MTNVLQKNFNIDDSTKEVYKYLCELVFSHPSINFDLSNTCLTLELIHTNEKSAKTRLSTLKMEFKYGQITRSLLCKQCISGFFMIMRHEPLPPINYVRAIHDCPGGTNIFLEAIEFNDQMTGERTFFAIKNHIYGIGMNEAVVHIIKPQELKFCSKQTFCPDFHCLHIEYYGEPIEKPAQYPEEIYGIRLLPKLNWFEEFVFISYLIHLSFAFMAGILFYFQDYSDLEKTIGSVLGSGLISPTVTQIMAFTYRFVIKRKYVSKCSPMKVEAKKSSVFWQLFRSLYLSSILALTVLLSILAIFLINEPLRLNYTFIGGSDERETGILITLLVFSLLIVYTVWLPAFAIIRFVFRLIFFKPKSVASDLESHTDRHDSDLGLNKGVTSPSPRSKLTPEKSERSEGLKSAKSRSRRHQKSRSVSDKKQDEEEDKYSDMDELNTGSVIVKPTKSVGYIDPNVFKLSDSKIDDPKSGGPPKNGDDPKTKKPKDSDKKK